MKYPKKNFSEDAKIMYPTIDVVAAAAIAFRKNHNKIVKSDLLTSVTETGEKKKPAKSNKTNIAEILSNPEQITDADREEAKEIIKHIQNSITMSLLSDKTVSPFTKNIATTLEAEQLSHINFGMIVYAPNLYFDAKRREKFTDKLLEMRYTSKPLGEVGEKVTIDFSLIEYKFVHPIDCYSVIGSDGKENLVQFFTKKDELCRSQKLTGKIKSAEENKYQNGAIFTNLNYVKIAK